MGGEVVYDDQAMVQVRVRMLQLPVRGRTAEDHGEEHQLHV